MPKKRPTYELDEQDLATIELLQKEKDRMFGIVPEEEKSGESVLVLKISELHSFQGHPFQVKSDDKMIELRDSVAANGVINPLLVRPRMIGGYEIISGHRRVEAARRAGLTDIKCIVTNLNDAQATILMVDSNLQREEILPSEKAKAYKMKNDAMKKVSGYRSDLDNNSTSGQVDPRLWSTEAIAQEAGESRKQVQRYIRLTNLIPQILDMVDDKQIAFNPAVEISYLGKEEQDVLYNIMVNLEATPSLAQAQELKRLSMSSGVDYNIILNLLNQKKPNQKEVFKFKRDNFSKYVEATLTPSEAEKTIIEKLDLASDVDEIFNKHINAQLSPDQKKQLIENLITNYAKTQNKTKVKSSRDER